VATQPAFGSMPAKEEMRDGYHRLEVDSHCASWGVRGGLAERGKGSNDRQAQAAVVTLRPRITGEGACAITTRCRWPEECDQSCMVRGGVSVVISDSDRGREKPTYRPAGWTPGGILSVRVRVR